MSDFSIAKEKNVQGWKTKLSTKMNLITTFKITVRIIGQFKLDKKYYGETSKGHQQSHVQIIFIKNHQNILCIWNKRGNQSIDAIIVWNHVLHPKYNVYTMPSNHIVTRCAWRILVARLWHNGYRVVFDQSWLHSFQRSNLANHWLIYSFLFILSVSSDGRFWTSSYEANTSNKCLELILRSP